MKVVDKTPTSKVIDATFIRTFGEDGDSSPTAFATLNADDTLDLFALYGKTNIMPRQQLPFSCTHLLGHPSVPILSVGTVDGRVLCLWVRIAGKSAVADPKGKVALHSDSREESSLSASATVFTERWLSQHSLEFGYYESVAAEEALFIGALKDGARETFLCSTAMRGEKWAENFSSVVDALKISAECILDRYFRFSSQMYMYVPGIANVVECCRR